MQIESESGEKYAYLSMWTGLFMPARRDDLNLGVGEHVGKRMALQFAGEVEAGPYAGQARFDVIGWQKPFVFGWAPECDFSDIKPMSDEEASSLLA